MCMRFIKVPKMSIQKYFENVVPLYTDEEFVKHFRISRSLFEELLSKYADSIAYKTMTKMNPNTVTLPDKTLVVFLGSPGVRHALTEI